MWWRIEQLFYEKLKKYVHNNLIYITFKRMFRFINFIMNSIMKKIRNYFTNNKKLCDKTMESEYYLPQTLNFIDENSELTYGMCLDRVKHNGALIVYVPQRLIDLDMCVTAIKNRTFIVDNHTYARLISCTQIREYGFLVNITDPNKSIIEEYKLYLPENRCTGNICLNNNPRCCKSVKYKCRLVYEMNDSMRYKYIINKEMRKKCKEYLNK